MWRSSIALRDDPDGYTKGSSVVLCGEGGKVARSLQVFSPKVVASLPFLSQAPPACQPSINPR